MFFSFIRIIINSKQLKYLYFQKGADFAMKKAFFLLFLLLGLTAALPFGVSAESAAGTGVTAPLLPWFIGLMAAAVVAIVVCLIFMKKKK